MSLIVERRMARAAERRDMTSAPWVTGETVPTPLQDTLGRYDPETVLKFAACVTCLGLRAGAFQQMPLKAYSDRDGAPQLHTPQPPLMLMPSLSARVPSVWKGRMSISRDVYGYALGIIPDGALDASGNPTRVEWVPAGQTKPKVLNAYGEIEWRINNEVWDSQRLVHIPSRLVTNEHPEGIAPLEYTGLLDLAKLVKRYAKDWFAGGGIPPGFLYSDQPLTKGQADTILTRVRQRWNRREPAIIGKGLKYEASGAKASESEVLSFMTRISADVALSFWMPPEKVGAALAGQSVTYANRDQAQQQWLIDGVNPDLVIIAELVSLLLAEGTYAKWTTAAILQSDAKTRAEIAAKEIDSGTLTPDEGRAREERAPLTEAQQIELDRQASRSKWNPADLFGVSGGGTSGEA